MLPKDKDFIGPEREEDHTMWSLMGKYQQVGELQAGLESPTHLLWGFE